MALYGGARILGIRYMFGCFEISVFLRYVILIVFKSIVPNIGTTSQSAGMLGFKNALDKRTNNLDTFAL